MSKLRELLQVSEEEKRKILEELETPEGEFVKITENIKNWFLKNENFPEDDGFMDDRIKMALLNGKMSMEKAKKTIESYFAMRFYHDDLFGRLIPNERFQRIKNMVIHAVVPKLLPNLSRLLIYRMEDIEEQASDVYNYYEFLLMVCDLRFFADFSLANEILIDMRFYSFPKFLKHTPNVSQKLVHILVSFGARISHIHIINTPNYMDRIITLVRAIMPAKIMDKLILHRSLDELYEYIPKDYLPLDFGGNLEPMIKIHDEWAKEIEDKAEMFKKFKSLTLKRGNEENVKISTELGSGIDGSFRQLAID